MLCFCKRVAILILLELTLQYKEAYKVRFPKEVAILILLELTLQFALVVEKKKYIICRNPYFIGINSAISMMRATNAAEGVAILILLELTLQYNHQ